jgi:MFS family permease
MVEIAQRAEWAQRWIRRPTASRNTVLVLLLGAYTFNFIDRSITSTLGQAIKTDLGLTDTELGLLNGLFFAIFYTLLAIPVARLAERRSRTWIISISVVVWSTFTALSALAGNFLQLGLMRIGVGIGEAGCSPPAHSLISDYFEPKKRAFALSVYALGIPIGTTLGAVAGGFLTEQLSWRAALVILGLPGILLGVAIKVLVREPVRGAAEPVSEGALPHAPPPPLSLGREISEIVAVGRKLFSNWTMLNLLAGVTIVSFGSYGFNGFTVPFLVRDFPIRLAAAGLIYGLSMGFANAFGGLMGGLLTDRLAARNRRWYALVPAAGVLLSAPLYLIAFQQRDVVMFAVILVPATVLHAVYLSPTFAVIQNAFDVRRRATAAAVVFFVFNLIALGGGPPLVGWLIDQLAAFDFAHPGVTNPVEALRGALDHTGADFASACPGGAAPRGSAPELQQACRRAQGAATRQAMLFSPLFCIWGAAHYAVAAIGLPRQLAALR